MAKKSRRKRRQRQPNVPQYTPPTETEDASEVEATAETTIAAPTAAPKVASSGSGMDGINWQAEYPYVLGDLRSMAIVAALMVALLLGLNFFLN